jgi:predicted TIM-barrel fold metal-dependent hydrolase
MSLVVDAHQHFWTYGTYQTSWMDTAPYAGDARVPAVAALFSAGTPRAGAEGVRRAQHP